MRKAKSIIWLILSAVVCSNCFSQYKKNAIVLEIAGKSFSFFDISYERYLSEKFHFGGGAGIGKTDHLYYNNGVPLNQHNFTIPLYGAYAFGLKKHHPISEFGLTLRGRTDFHGHTSLTSPLPFISFGYEYKGKDFIFRAPIYLTYIGRNEFFPPIVPWVGLSFGKLF